jgi:hypothetical protein
MYKFSPYISLVTEEMCNTLETGERQDWLDYPVENSSVPSTNKEPKKSPKALKGVYLVNIRVLNRNQNKLHYSYIYYPKIFSPSIVFYLLDRQKTFNFSKWMEPGPYLPIFHIDFFNNFLDDEPFYDQCTKYDSQDNKLYQELYRDLFEEYYRLKDPYNLICFIHKLMLCGNYISINKIISLAYNRKYAELFQQILYKTILPKDVENT